MLSRKHPEVSDEDPLAGFEPTDSAGRGLDGVAVNLRTHLVFGVKEGRVCIEDAPYIPPTFCLTSADKHKDELSTGQGALHMMASMFNMPV
eukprot:1143875-Pelagomonas_calceolata.AAC.3